MGERKRRITRLRRKNVTNITGFAADDRVSASWDVVKREWRLLIESANGLRIENVRLTSGQAAA
jgi:hypothetical protein